MALTDAERQAAYRLRNPYQKKTIEIVVDGKKYIFKGTAIQPGSKDLLRKLIQGVKKWKENPTQENWVKIFRVEKPKLPGKPQQYRQLLFSEELRRFLQGRELESGVTKGVFEQSNIKKLLNISEADINKIKTYTPEYFASVRGLAGSKVAALRTPVQRGTNDLPEIIKIFDKYKYNTNLTTVQNQDAIIAQLKNNPTIIKRFKEAGTPLTFKNLKERIARTHSAIISNTLNKKNYGDLFKAFSLADRQNFLTNAQKMFTNTITRSFQGQLVDTLKGNELKLASDKLSKFSKLRKFISDRMGHVGGKHAALIQMDHPISLAALDKSGNLNQALRVNPIAGDINIWKRKLDQRLNSLQKKGDVRGLRALNEINQALFGKGSPSFTAGAEGISKIKGLPADFRKANLRSLLEGNVGLHETLKQNIKTVRPEAWTKAGFTLTSQANVVKELNALKSWDPKVLTRLIEEWTDKNPKWTKILEKRIGCQSGCLAAAANESPAAFSEVLKKTPAAARSFLGTLGKFGAKAAPLAAIAGAGVLAEPLVKQFRSDDYSTYLSDPEQQKGMLLSMVEAETPKVDQEILKWQYPGMAAGAASAIPGSGAVYGARRKPFKSIKRGIDRAAMGPARAALGPVGKFLAGTFSPLGLAATLPISVAAQVKGGSDVEDIATDPFNWLGPAFASTGAKIATRGMAPTGILAKAIRMGMSPATLRAGSRFLGMPGLALSAGLTGYDWWKNRGKDKDDEFKVRTYKDDDD